MRDLNGLDWLAIVLVIIGALNWGLIGLFGYDLVAGIFGQMSGLSRFIYTLVGLSGLYLAFVAPAFARRVKERESPVTR